MKKQNKGITLIALIITVIVLIILASVSINLILGQGGLFNKAQQAGMEYKKEEAKEKLQLVLIDLQVDKSTNKQYNDQEYVNNKLQENNMQVDGNIVTVYGWQFQIDRATLKIVEKGTGTGTGTGETVSAAVISNNPEKYYGQEVQYSTKSDVTIASIDSIQKLNLVANVDEQLKNEGITWKIFYADKEHIYLITSDYVKVDGDNYYKVFNTAAETLQFMNTQSNWKQYVGNDAEYAVGGPTFTMFCNSWNAKYPDNQISGATGNEQNGWTIDYDFDIHDALYSKQEDTFYGYWLASNSANKGSRYLVHVGEYGVSSYGYAFSPEYGGEEQNLVRFGFRPIVCLKSDVELQATDEGFIIFDDSNDDTNTTT